MTFFDGSDVMLLDPIANRRADWPPAGDVVGWWADGEPTRPPGTIVLDARSRHGRRVWLRTTPGLGALPGTTVYLDGVHSAWLTVGDNVSRLIRAGVQDADGFFVNTSNFQYTANVTAYGTWVSSCIAYVTQVAPLDYSGCPNQYWNGGPATGWSGVAMNSYGVWSAGNPDPALNTSGIDSRYDLILGSVEPSTHFVIDTSRNGRGPWDSPDGVYSDPEEWCNPPGRGLGPRPTLDTGNALVDAHLWIKVPGESDGQCYRGTSGPLDPARGIEDPAAGGWFVQQARELIEQAVPTIP